MTRSLLWNTLAVGAGATLVAAVLGLLSGLWFCLCTPGWQRLWLGSAVATLALPSFLVADAWLSMFGTAGLLHAWLPVPLGSTLTVALVLGSGLWPLVALAVWSVWSVLDRELFEVEPGCNGLTLLRQVMIPYARSAWMQGAMVALCLAVANLTIPALFQVHVAPVAFWLAFSTTWDYAAAFKEAWPILALPVAALMVWRPVRVAFGGARKGVPAEAMRRLVGPRLELICSLGFVLALGLGLVLPLGMVILRPGTWEALPGAFEAGWHTIGTSMLFAFGGASGALILALLMPRRWGPRPGWLPFLFPGVLLGLGMLVLSQQLPLRGLAVGLGLVVGTMSIRCLGIAWSGVAGAFASLPRELGDEARLVGAGFWARWSRLEFPLIRRQLAAAWYLVYLFCLWDVETPLFLAPPGVETVAQRTFSLLHYGHQNQVDALCVMILVAALLPLAALSLPAGWRMISRFGSGRGTSVGVGILVGALPLAACLLSGCDGSGGGKTQGASLQSRLFSGVAIIGERGTGVGQFNKPRSLAAGAHGSLFVTDMTGRVQAFTTEGRHLCSWQMPQTDLGKPKGMCMDGAGRLIVIEPHYSRVNHFSEQGVLLAQWGSKGQDVGRLGLPRSVAVNSRGEIYISEYGEVERVQRFTADGSKCLGAFGVTGGKPGQFARPEGLCIDRHDRVIVADSCNHRVQFFDAEGHLLKVLGSAGSAPGQFSYPYDVKTDGEDHLFVCEFGNSRIQVFGADGALLEVLGGPGAGPGQFSNPWSICLDAEGNLYVADAGNHRVQKLIRKRGTAQVREHEATGGGNQA